MQKAALKNIDASLVVAFAPHFTLNDPLESLATLPPTVKQRTAGLVAANVSETAGATTTAAEAITTTSTAITEPAAMEICARTIR